MNPAISGVIKDAQVKGTPAVMRSLLGYAAASRAAQGGQAAFMDATKYVVSNMLRSMTKKLEIQMLYGQMGLGKISSVASNVLTIKTSEWAPGIWAGAEGMPLDVYDSASISFPQAGTLRGTSVVKSVDMDLRTVTLEVAIPGIVTTLNSEDVVFQADFYGKEFPGIHRILISTGILFNIDSSKYNLFKGNQFDGLAGALSFSKLNKASTRAVEKGLEGKLLALTNPRGWADMLNDQAALRSYDQSYSASQLENGANKLKFHSQNGEIEITPSIYVKEGHCFLLSMDEWIRVGSSDVSFQRPGQSDKFFRDLENSAAYELRLFTDQALFTSAPGRNVIIYNIVNSVS